MRTLRKRRRTSPLTPRSTCARSKARNPVPMSRLRALLSLAALATLPACPTDATPPAAASGPPGASVPDPDDPRVVRDSDDLYTVDNAPNPPEPGPALGSGTPDTTNGVCKLYAPKLPEPECCPIETGFDAEAIRELCGNALYLGESLHGSCGYFYMPKMENSKPVAIRTSIMSKTEVAEAAAEHDMQLARVTQNREFKSTPVPGFEDALWSSHEHLNWAFIPGWDKIRLVSWNASVCPIDKMPEVLRLISTAKPPPPNAPRELIPKARR